MLTSAYEVRQCDLLSAELVQVISEGCPLVHSYKRSAAPVLGDLPPHRGSLNVDGRPEASGVDDQVHVLLAGLKVIQW